MPDPPFASDRAGRPVVARARDVAAEQLARGDRETAELLYQQVLEADRDDAVAADALGELRRRSPARRAVGRVARSTVENLAQRPRILKYRVLSTCPRRRGSPIILQPVLFVGPGEVVLGEGVQFGWRASPHFYSGYCHIEVARVESRIEVGDRTEFNNNLMMKSEGPGISVGRDGLFGANVEIFDSDFHDLHPARRRSGSQRMAAVEIGDNVFVGMGVRILKGVTIGSDTVIGAGAVVSSSIPSGVVAAGNPARVLREL